MTTLKSHVALIGALGLLLAGCSSPADQAPPPTGTFTPPVAQQDDFEPDYHKAHIIDIVSGDTLRVQLTYAVKRLPRGKLDEREVAPETIEVRSAILDAPDPGECGFEESRDALSRLHGSGGQPFVFDEGRLITVSLDNSDTVRKGIPNLDEAGRPVYWIGTGPTRSHSNQVHNGFAKVPGWIKGDAVGSPYDASQFQEQAQYSDAGLWETCWAG